MSFQGFLYRRLSRWATCELQLPSGRILPLRTKYDVASASDVFCHPFYWQFLSLLDREPGLVVDCGANCGHFSILAEECIRLRFHQASPRYLLVEPNPLVLPILKRNLELAGMSNRSTICQGLLGLGEAKDALIRVSSSNYLSASVSQQARGRAFSVPCLKLGDLVHDAVIDILKVDIEGGEFGLVESEPAMFSQTRILLMELHGVDGRRQEGLLAMLRGLGFSAAAEPLSHGDHKLLAMRNAGLISGVE